MQQPAHLLPPQVAAHCPSQPSTCAAFHTPCAATAWAICHKACNPYKPCSAPARVARRPRSCLPGRVHPCHVHATSTVQGSILQAASPKLRAYCAVHSYATSVQDLRPITVRLQSRSGLSSPSSCRTILQAVSCQPCTLSSCLLIEISAQLSHFSAGLAPYHCEAAIQVWPLLPILLLLRVQPGLAALQHQGTSTCTYNSTNTSSTRTGCLQPALVAILGAASGHATFHSRLCCPWPQPSSHIKGYMAALGHATAMFSLLPSSTHFVRYQVHSGCC